MGAALRRKAAAQKTCKFCEICRHSLQLQICYRPDATGPAARPGAEMRGLSESFGNIPRQIRALCAQHFKEIALAQMTGEKKDRSASLRDQLKLQLFHLMQRDRPAGTQSHRGAGPRLVSPIISESSDKSSEKPLRNRDCMAPSASRFARRRSRQVFQIRNIIPKMAAITIWRMINADIVPNISPHPIRTGLRVRAADLWHDAGNWPLPRNCLRKKR